MTISIITVEKNTFNNGQCCNIQSSPFPTLGIGWVMQTVGCVCSKSYFMYWSKVLFFSCRFLVSGLFTSDDPSYYLMKLRTITIGQSALTSRSALKDSHLQSALKDNHWSVSTQQNFHGFKYVLLMVSHKSY